MWPRHLKAPHHGCEPSAGPNQVHHSLKQNISLMQQSFQSNLSPNDFKLPYFAILFPIWVFPKMVVPPISTPKWSFLAGKPIVVGDHYFRKPPIWEEFSQTSDPEAPCNFTIWPLSPFGQRTGKGAGQRIWWRLDCQGEAAMATSMAN